MITVKELIKRLEKENQDAIVLVNGYEYGMEYLRLKTIETGKFKLPKKSDSNSYGGTIEKDNNGDFDFLLIGRST
jgi:glycogen synthase